MPCGDCRFAAASCGQGVQGGQRAPVLAGGTGAERGNVSCCGRGVRNSRQPPRTLKPILAVCTLGNSVSAKYRLYRSTHRRCLWVLSVGPAPLVLLGRGSGATGAPEGERASLGPPLPPPHPLIVDVRSVQVLLSLRLRIG